MKNEMIEENSPDTKSQGIKQLIPAKPHAIKFAPLLSHVFH